jgi:hypothetical protein
MGTFWDAFGWLLEVVGRIWGNEKIVPEIGWPKGAQGIPRVPGSSGIDPCVPLKDFPGLEGLQDRYHD